MRQYHSKVIGINRKFQFTSQTIYFGDSIFTFGAPRLLSFDEFAGKINKEIY